MRVLKLLSLAALLYTSPLDVSNRDVSNKSLSIADKYDKIYRKVEHFPSITIADLEKNNIPLTSFSLLAIQEYQFETIYDKVIEYADSLGVRQEEATYLVRQESAYRQAHPITGEVTSSEYAKASLQMVEKTFLDVNKQFDLNRDMGIAFSPTLEALDHILPVALSHFADLRNTYPCEEHALIVYNYGTRKINEIKRLCGTNVESCYWRLPKETRGYVRGWNERGLDSKEEIKEAMMKYYEKEVRNYFVEDCKPLDTFDINHPSIQITLLNSYLKAQETAKRNDYFLEKITSNYAICTND